MTTFANMGGAVKGKDTTVVYLISYDLVERPSESTYPELIGALEQAGAVRILKSQWLYHSNESAMQVADRFLPHLDNNDRIFVNEVTRNSAYRGIINEDRVKKGFFPHLRAA